MSRTTITDDDGGIPTVVQRALGMQNLSTHQNYCNDGASTTNNFDHDGASNTIANNNNVMICGLEGFLLPRYLALRSGRNIQQASDSSFDMLMRAKNEELQHRLSGHKQQKVDASSKSNRPRKRKRKSDHHGKSNNNNTNKVGTAVRGVGADNDIDMQSQSPESDAPTKSKRRKRRRRRKSSNQSNNTNNSNKDDWIHYQMMARIIVAPFTSSLITTMNKCKQIEKQNQKSCSHDVLIDTNHEQHTTPKVNQATSSTTSNTAEKRTDSVPATVKNVYQKNKSTNSTHLKPNNNLLLTLSSPQESLATIVDGAVCTLVRRTHRHRSTKSSAMFKGCRNNNVGKKEQQILYRRRQRQKSTGDTSMATPSSTTTNTNNSNNNWLLEQNLLSTGYTLGSGETYSSSHNNNNNTNQNNQLLRGCPNMAPGIHCLHPNTLTSYARSSQLMKILHSLIGDDALREMLVNAVIVVPAISSTTEDSGWLKAEGEQQSVFDRGNYFQLCGPPLNKLAKKFDEMSSSVEEAAASGNSRKRKRNDMVEDDPNDMDTKLKKRQPNNLNRDEERWDPNRPIPRGNLFYCDFYNRHVGLSPNHLLNQSDEDVSSSAKESSTTKSNNNMDVNVKLLNSMVRLWPGRPYQSNTSSKVSIIINGNKRRGRWRRLRESGINMCQEMRRRHKQCDYARLLERHFPLPIDTSTSTNDDIKTTLSHYVTFHTPVDNVGSFLEAVLGSAFPNSFWGSIHNFHQVIRTVRVFVQLGRTEQLPEKAIVDGIRVLDMKWLLPNTSKKNKDSSAKSNKRRKLSRSEHGSTSVLVRNVMRWLYKQFIIPLLRSTFYITETEFTGSRVLYYRRPIWSRIKSLSMKILLKQQYREMNVAKVQKLLSNHNVGCPPAPLRLLPKKTGIRAIAMLSKSCETDDAMAAIMNQQLSMAPPNKILQSTFHALKYEHEKKPTLFGAGVLGLTEVFPSFCTFVEALKQRRSNNGGSTTTNSRLDDQDSQLYFASADIKHCYDNINQKHLLKLMKSVIDEDVYMTKNNFILHSKDNKSSLRCRWKKNTFSTDQFSSFLATSNALVDKCFNSILVDGVHCSMEKKETITGLLRDHIFGQVVVANGNHGQRYLLQRNGIPQVSYICTCCST